MRGGDVFNFVIREIPRDIKKTIEFSGISLDAIDYYIFHQANNYINSFIAKKMKLDNSKIPQTINKYGNTSSVSVPLTIVSELRGKLFEEKTLLLSAFGVGMCWSTAIIPFIDCNISNITEVENGEPIQS